MGWNTRNTIWQNLTPYQRAAAIAMMEPNSRSPTYLRDAQNSLGAIINRSEAIREPLSSHVERANWYQPLIEPTQEARLKSIIAKPEFQQLADLAERRASGSVPDWVGGATHYLAKPQEMLELERNEPNKYLNWGPRGQNWTGYDPATGQYANQVFQDGSHAFLRPAEFGGGGASNKPSNPPPLGAVDNANVIDTAITRAVPVAADTNPFSTRNLFAGLGSGAAAAASSSPAFTSINDTAMQEAAHMDLMNGPIGSSGSLLSALFGGDMGGGDIGGALGGIGQMLGGGGGGGDSAPKLQPAPMPAMKHPTFNIKQLAEVLRKRGQLGSGIRELG